MDAVTRCRHILEELTPLETDCGLLCGSACCRSLPGEETGMLLFPGEAEGYRDRPGWKVIPSEAGEIVICPGRCERGERPLSCRLFPLLPLRRGGEIRVAMDARAAAVCPLYGSGARGLVGSFVEAVRACGQELARDEDGLAFLLRLTAQHDELRAMRKRFRG